MAPYKSWLRDVLTCRHGTWFVILCIAACLTGCPKSPQFCCLEYERTGILATYCNNHSGAVGYYLADLSSDSAKVAWLDKFDLFSQRIQHCPEPQCIAESIRVNYESSEFFDFYQSEHDDAEDALADQTAVSLGAAEKADLIRCGFRDAIDRTRENLKKE